ncbi:MAG: response regulator transcription factor [Leptolyngbyaceae cyanobacterium SM1_3_5]|nr:response regulator transcription factor [Leptolyngbyaceae cyanobacterium SM1_3_5]
MPVNLIRILLVEDDELFRLGLRMRLQQEAGLEIVAEAEDGETAVDLANQQQIDVVLLDIGLPGISGIEACRRIKQHQPKLPILVLTSHTQASMIQHLMAAGAQGYCLKGAAAETIILAVRSIATGASWWDTAATTEIRAKFKQPTVSAIPEASSNSAFEPLTRREQEILTLIAVGKTNQEIANLLHITAGTVRVHVHAILQKLNVHDRTQAAILAINKKLISKDLL